MSFFMRDNADGLTSGRAGILLVAVESAPKVGGRLLPSPTRDPSQSRPFCFSHPHFGVLHAFGAPFRSFNVVHKA